LSLLHDERLEYALERYQRGEGPCFQSQSFPESESNAHGSDDAAKDTMAPEEDDVESAFFAVGGAGGSHGSVGMINLWRDPHKKCVQGLNDVRSKLASSVPRFRGRIKFLKQVGRCCLFH
jgi:hypothetical protein